ncbi:MAG: Clp protease N-terminal domain-containing protein, partial [Anaerotignum sp.]
MESKYTKKAKDVLARAQEAALKLGNKYVGTEHILLGLTLVKDSVAANALETLGVTYHQVMDRIVTMNEFNKNFYVPVDYTPRAKRVVEFSKQEALRMGMNYIGTEHILLSLIEEDDNIATKILKDLNVHRQRIYVDIMNMLGGN